jgi:hypothetical protein
MTERGVYVRKFSTNSMRGFCPGVPSNIARVLNPLEGSKSVGVVGWCVTLHHRQNYSRCSVLAILFSASM